MGEYNEGERSHKHAFAGDSVHDQHLKMGASKDSHLKLAADLLGEQVKSMGKSPVEKERLKGPEPMVKKVEMYKTNGKKGKAI